MNVTSAVSPCTLAIDNAQRELEEADAKRGETQPLTNSNETTNNDNSIDYDPDDLAAAFFAAEARKKKEANKLPIKEWSDRFPGLKLRPSQSKDDADNNDECDSDDSNEFMDRVVKVRTRLKEQIIQSIMHDLVEEAKKKMANTNTGANLEKIK